MKLVLLPQAQETLDLIYEPLLSRVLHKLEMLQKYPMMGPAMSEPFIEYRTIVIDFFRVVYRLKNDTIIEISYIRDCRRKPL
jgi:plasmid stabilization system protein ParE